MNEAAQFVVTGLGQGAIYAMIGVGFVLIYNVTGIINFAQGEYLVIGALSATTLVAAGLPLPIAFVAATLLAAMAGGLSERLTIATARKASLETKIIITIGLAIVLQGLALLIWGVDSRRLAPFTAGPPVEVLSVSISRQILWVAAFAVTVAIMLGWFLTRTILGKAMRACAMNPEAARLQGISPSNMSLAAFMLSTGIAGAAGVMLVPITSASYDMGLFLALKGFTAAAIGGMVSPPGAIAGGLLLGAAESLAAGYVSSGLKDAIAFTVLLVVLVARPSGILSSAKVKVT